MYALFVYRELLNRDTLPTTMQPFYQIEGRFAGRRALVENGRRPPGDDRVCLQLRHFEDESALEEEALQTILHAARLNGTKLHPTLDDAIVSGGLYLEREGIQPHTLLLNSVHETACRSTHTEKLLARSQLQVVWADVGEKFVVILGEPDLLGVLCVSEMDPLLAGVLVFAKAAFQVKIGIQRTLWDWLDEPAV